MLAYGQHLHPDLWRWGQLLCGNSQDTFLRLGTAFTNDHQRIVPVPVTWPQKGLPRYVTDISESQKGIPEDLRWELHGGWIVLELCTPTQLSLLYLFCSLFNTQFQFIRVSPSCSVLVCCLAHLFFFFFSVFSFFLIIFPWSSQHRLAGFVQSVGCWGLGQS